MTAPIIVDTRPRCEESEEGEPFKWDSYTNLSIPFECFWVEGFTDRGQRWGAFTRLKRFTKWGGMALFVLSPAGWLDRPFVTAMPMLSLNEDGSFDRKCVEPAAGGHVDTRILEQLSQEEIHTHILSMVDNLLDVLRLLGCKNVSLNPHHNEPTGASRQMVRNEGKPKAFTYHTLMVRPAGASSSSTGVDIGNMPRHVCRGHFAEYGPEFGKGLLFGKYAGRFYVPPHLKGKEENGIVEKDYVLTTKQ